MSQSVSQSLCGNVSGRTEVEEITSLLTQGELLLGINKNVFEARVLSSNRGDFLLQG
jgi:hypothetical protein